MALISDAWLISLNSGQLRASSVIDGICVIGLSASQTIRNSVYRNVAGWKEGVPLIEIKINLDLFKLL